MAKPKAKQTQPEVNLDDLTPEEQIAHFIKYGKIDDLQRIYDENDGDVYCSFEMMWPEPESSDDSGSENEEKEAKEVVEVDQTYPPDSLLTLAIREDRLDAVEWLLERGASRKIRVSPGGRTCFHLVVEGKKMEMLQALLKDQRVFRKQEEDGEMGEVEEEEIDWEEDIYGLDILNDENKTALDVALEQYEIEICQALIKAGATLDFNADEQEVTKVESIPKIDVNPIDNETNTEEELASDSEKESLPLLHRSVVNGDVKMFETLLSIGQNPFGRTKLNSQTVLHLAAKHDRKEIFDFLNKFMGKLPSEFLEYEDIAGLTALDYALNSKNIELFKYIASKLGGNLLYQSKRDGMTIFHRSAISGNKENLELILGMKFKINEIDKFKNTGLHYTCRSGNIECTKFLLDKKAPINDVNDLGESPLHLACRSGNLEVVELLLSDKKLNVVAVSNRKYNALHEACESGNVSLIDPLLDINAGGKTSTNQINIESETIQEFTALEICLHRGFETVAAKIIQRGANINRMFKPDYVSMNKHYRTLFQQAVQLQYVDVVKAMVASVDETLINEPDDNGFAPLHNAVKSNNWEICQALLSHEKIDLNATDSQNLQTPLIIACQHGYLRLVESLLAHGCSLDSVDADGTSAIEYICLLKHSVPTEEAVTQVEENEMESQEQSGATEEGVSKNNNAELGEENQDVENNVPSILSIFEQIGSQTTVPKLKLLHLSCQSNNLPICDFILNSMNDATQQALQATDLNHSESDAPHSSQKIETPDQAPSSDNNSALIRTPIHTCILYNSLSCLERLIQDGRFNILGKDESGRTPLILSSELGRIDAARILIRGTK